MDSESSDALSPWITERLSALMEEHGVAQRQQAGTLSELCGLSPSQARRKMHGASWSFAEVFTIVKHFGASLDDLFQAAAAGEIAPSSAASEYGLLPHQEARFLLGEHSVQCKVRLGALVSGKVKDAEILAVQNDDGWVVGTSETLEKQHIGGRSFHAEQILLTPETDKPRIRIAILDDDSATSESLCEWFNDAGFAASAFSSSAQLLGAPLDQHDVFIIDYLLAAGESSHETIDVVRRALPTAPILLLTGKLREGLVSETELTTLLRTANVAFFEKPVRPSVLAASIENAMDHLAGRS